MKRQLPIAICFLTGFYSFVQYFSPHPDADFIAARLLKWVTIVGFFALVLGLISLWITHLPKVMKQAPGWGYNATTLLGFVGMAVAGLVWGRDPGTPFLWAYNNLLNPITSTMFALLAYFIASAAYRAFRMRSLLATILLVSAVIIMLGRVPLGDLISFGVLGKAANWLLNYPNLAAKRAVLIGIGFGQTAVALKILLGIERSYLGGADK